MGMQPLPSPFAHNVLDEMNDHSTYTELLEYNELDNGATQMESDHNCTIKLLAQEPSAPGVTRGN
jgi:hypothetical protein